MKPILMQWRDGPVWPKGFLWHIEIAKELQGCVIPRWYLGFAYADWSRDVGHYYVVPLNLFITFGRWCWFGLRFEWARRFATHRCPTCGHIGRDTDIDAAMQEWERLRALEASRG